MIDFNQPHRRKNLLTGEWILVSPHRTQRPWKGKKETVNIVKRPKYDAKCYLCPGNTRANGEVNPDYKDVYVFTNDFSALLPDVNPNTEKIKGLFQAEQASGTCRVVCFSPEHDLSLALASSDVIVRVVEAWRDQLNELKGNYPFIQIFENKGEIMGCSNPHPHGQIWAGSFVPQIVARESENQHDYFVKNKSPLLLDYLEEEMRMGKRVVLENEDWAVLAPFWALWPYETILLPKSGASRLEDLGPGEVHTLSLIMKKLLVKYDNLFNVSFPYSMGWHYCPYDRKKTGDWVLHAHFYPPLLRSATVKKFMVGYEMLSEAQRDITAEQAAEKLASLSEIHYLSY